MKIQFYIWEDSCIILKASEINDLDELINVIKEKNDDKVLNLKDETGKVYEIKPSDVNAIKIIF